MMTKILAWIGGIGIVLILLYLLLYLVVSNMTIYTPR
jgi:hypothetical protein